MYQKFVKYFFQGLFYLAPLAVTAYIIYKIIILFDSWFFELTDKNIPGIGILVIIVGVTFLGFLTDVYLAKPIISLIHSMLAKIPIIKELYFPFKDIFDTISGKNKKFSKPVLAKVNPATNVEKLGFIMQESLTHVGIKGEKVAVYFPHSFAFSGELYIIPAENITPLDIPASVAMKFIVSGGAINLKNHN